MRILTIHTYTYSHMSSVYILFRNVYDNQTQRQFSSSVYLRQIYPLKMDYQNKKKMDFLQSLKILKTLFQKY